MLRSKGIFPQHHEILRGEQVTHDLLIQALVWIAAVLSLTIPRVLIWQPII
jgi:hypothetical protein